MRHARIALWEILLLLGFLATFWIGLVWTLVAPPIGFVRYGLPLFRTAYINYRNGRRRRGYPSMARGLIAVEEIGDALRGPLRNHPRRGPLIELLADDVTGPAQRSHKLLGTRHDLRSAPHDGGIV